VGRWAVRRFDCGFGGEDGGDARLKVYRWRARWNLVSVWCDGGLLVVWFGLLTINSRDHGHAHGSRRSELTII